MVIAFYMNEDVNECTMGTSNCTQLCINNIGSYTCTCNSGYNLDADNHTCNGEYAKEGAVYYHWNNSYQPQ